MGKNSKIHLWLETELKESVEKRAKEKEISIAEFCRRKLKENDKLDTILSQINKLISIIENK